MSESKTKGTPRKRPYDVKRKLERAIARFKKQGKRLVTGTFGDLICEDGVWRVPQAGCGCAISAYVDGTPAATRENGGRDFCSDAADRLGLTIRDVRAIWHGFDNPSCAYNAWSKLGAELAPAAG